VRTYTPVGGSGAVAIEAKYLVVWREIQSLSSSIDVPLSSAEPFLLAATVDVVESQKWKFIFTAASADTAISSYYITLELPKSLWFVYSFTSTTLPTRSDIFRCTFVSPKAEPNDNHFGTLAQLLLPGRPDLLALFSAAVASNGVSLL
jgi:hypothetical protein